MNLNLNYYQILGVTFQSTEKEIKKTSTYEEALKLNHYSNFQALWAIDNLKKYNHV